MLWVKVTEILYLTVETIIHLRLSLCYLSQMRESSKYSYTPVYETNLAQIKGMHRK
jgi:hypothetical protein